ncbi:MAG: hypothetical protein NTU51_01860 [Bacteroidetes bacterium]|nr:hypothetical protein [Bacteroidota bacterium]
MKVLFPENLNLKQLLEENPPGFNYKEDKFYYIIGLIWKQKEKNDKLINRKLVPICAKLLQGVIKDYHQYLKYLLDNDVLRTDGQYIPEFRSCHFGFGEKYINQPVNYHEIKDYCLLKNLTKRYDQLNNKKRTSLPYADKQKKFGIDSEAFEKIRRRLEVAQVHGWTKAINRNNFKLSNLLAIEEHNDLGSCDTTSGRFHGPLTRQPRGCRRFNTYNGEKNLVAIDMKSAQPLLYALLFDPEFYDPTYSGDKFTLAKIFYASDQWKARIQKTIKNLFTGNETYSSKPWEYDSTVSSVIPLGKEEASPKSGYGQDTRLPHIPPPIMIPESELSPVISGFSEFLSDPVNIDSLNRYKTEVSSGNFWNYYMEEYEKRTGRSFKTKKQAKNFFWHMIYSRPENKERAKEITFQIFPHLRLLERFKTINHATLPILMQTIESNLFLNHICLRLYTEYPAIDFYTIHDCIVCHEEHREVAERMILSETTKFIGLTPAVSMEYLK